MRCLGVVIYADGSMAEVLLRDEVVFDFERDDVEFIPIPQRKLLLAPFGTERP